MLALMVSRRDLIRGLKDGGQQASAGLARARFRLVLVGAQVVGCCVSTPGQNLTIPPVENLTDRRGDEPQAVATS
jgi:hypothetical protein